MINMKWTRIHRKTERKRKLRQDLSFIELAKTFDRDYPET
jgi:hypothetical protein